MDSPLVSIITPFYNSSLYIKDYLESINSQSLNNIEVIIIDDGSDLLEQQKLDESILQFPLMKINIIRNKTNHGAAYARNQGMENARGKYLTFIDSDDMLCGIYSLEYRVNFLEKNSEFQAIAGYPLIIDIDNKISYLPDKKIHFFKKGVEEPQNLIKIYCSNLIENTTHSASTLFFLAGSTLFRQKNIADNPFDPTYEMEEDVECLIRFLKNNLVKLDMLPFHYRRIHPKQYHLTTTSKMTLEVIDLAKQVLEQ